MATLKEMFPVQYLPRQRPRKANTRTDNRGNHAEENYGKNEWFCLVRRR